MCFTNEETEAQRQGGSLTAGTSSWQMEAPQTWEGGRERCSSLCWCPRDMTGSPCCALLFFGKRTLLGEERETGWLISSRRQLEGSLAPVRRKGRFRSGLGDSMGLLLEPWLACFPLLFLGGFSDRGWTSHPREASLLLDFCPKSYQEALLPEKTRRPYTCPLSSLPSRNVKLLFPLP